MHLKMKTRADAAQPAPPTHPEVQSPPYAELFDRTQRGFTIHEAARAMRVSPVTVKRLIRAGKLKSVKVGERRIVTPFAA